MLERRSNLNHRHRHHRKALHLFGDNSSSSDSNTSSNSDSSTSSSKPSSTSSSNSSSTSSNSSTSTSSDSSKSSDSSSTDSKSSTKSDSSSSSSSKTSSDSSTSSSDSSSPTSSSLTNSDGVPTATVTAPSSNNSSSSPALGTGPIVGIAAGGVAAIILLAIIIGCCIRRKSKKPKSYNPDPFNRNSFKHEAQIIPDPIEDEFRPNTRPNLAGLGSRANSPHQPYMPPPSLPTLAATTRNHSPQIINQPPFDPYARPPMMIPTYKSPSPSYFPTYSENLIPPHPPNINRSPSILSHSAHISSPPLYSPPQNDDVLPNPHDNKQSSNKANDSTTATYRPPSLRPGYIPSNSNNLNDAYAGI